MFGFAQGRWGLRLYGSGCVVGDLFIGFGKLRRAEARASREGLAGDR